MSPVIVILFGGYLATQAQMKSWVDHASKPGYTFRAYAWPKGAKSDAAGAVKGAADTLAKLQSEISKSKNKYIIAGHSSGAAIANDLALRVERTGRVSLVDLDGFVASRNVQMQVPTTCWNAKTGKGLVSRNYAAMKGCVKPARTYVKADCETAWCLHFSLVNKRTPVSLVKFWAHGYDGVGSNVDWVEQGVLNGK